MKAFTLLNVNFTADFWTECNIILLVLHCFSNKISRALASRGQGRRIKRRAAGLPTLSRFCAPLSSVFTAFLPPLSRYCRRHGAGGPRRHAERRKRRLSAHASKYALSLRVFQQAKWPAARSKSKAQILRKWRSFGGCILYPRLSQYKRTNTVRQT